MDRKCNSTRCIEFNEAILADVIDLRKDILGNLMKAEKIIGLLGGTPLTSVLTAAAEIKDEETSAEDSTAYLDQGLRLNASDYTNDVVGLGKAGVGVFNKGHRKSRIDGNDIDLILAGDQTSSVIGRGSTSSATPSKKMSRSPLPARTPKIIRESNDSGDFDSRFGSAIDIDAMLSASGDDVVQESIAVPVLPQPSIYAKTSDPIAYTPTYAKAFGLPTTARDFKSVHSGTPKAGQSGKQLNQLQYSDYSNKTKEISEAPGNFGSVGNVASSKGSAPSISRSAAQENNGQNSNTHNNNRGTESIEHSKLAHSISIEGSISDSKSGVELASEIGLPSPAPITNTITTLELAVATVKEEDEDGKEKAGGGNEVDSTESSASSIIRALASHRSSIDSATNHGRGGRSSLARRDMTHRASVDGTRSDEYSDDSRTPKAGKSSTIRLPPGPPPRFPGTLKRSQSHRAITRQLMGKSEMRASFDSVDSSDAAGMYLSVEDVPLQKSAGLNFKGSTNLKRKPDKSAGSITSGFVSVNIGDDEEYVGRPDKSNASIASTEIPRYTFAPTKPGASVFHLAGLDRQKTVITPKDGLSRSFTANSYRMKRDKSEKPISEFDPQNKNISAIQQDRARSRRTSLAYSIMGSKHTTNTSRRTSTSYSIHQRRDSHILQPHLRKYSADPSVQSSTIARERTPKSSAQSEHLRRSYISLDLQQESMAELTLYQKCMCFIVLPAYDNKGRNLTLDQFDEADFEAISFNVNGLHPKSYFITLWDFLTSFGYCAVLWIIPFLTSYVHELPADLIWMCSILFTVFFAIDSIISLITPQPRTVNLMGSFREYESMRPALSEWMIDWIRGNLILEGISMIPFELIFHDKDYYIFLFWLRFLRFPRLGDKVLRCAYFTKAKLWADKLMGMGFSKIVPIAFGIFYFIHFNACAIYLTGSREGFLGWSILWPQFDPSAVYQVYTWTFFQAVGNIFPMSFKPQTAFEQAFAIVFIVIGAVLYAAFVGYVSSAAMSINPSGRLYNQKMEELIDYVRWKNLSEETKDKLVSYYETKYRGKYFEEDTLLSDMNESLREEIALHNTQRLIEKVPFLQRNELDGRDEIFFHRIATVLHAHYFIPGDFIIKQGDSGNEMYFILSGKVNVYVNGAKVVSLYDGAYLGEVSLITRHLRTATVQAVLPCVLYKLTRHDFHAVINEFPDMKNRIEKLAREAERMVKQAEESKQ